MNDYLSDTLLEFYFIFMSFEVFSIITFQIIRVLCMAPFRGTVVHVTFRNNLLLPCSGSLRQIEVHKKLLKNFGHAFIFALSLDRVL